MRKRMGVPVLFLGVVCSAAFFPSMSLAQSCEDDEAMVESYRKDIASLVDTTRKESLAEFEKSFHQKSCLTKLSLCLSLADELLNCLDKAGQDPAATKQQAEDTKAKRESYTKLRNRVSDDHKSLKAAETSKDAKALIEKFDLSP